MRLAAGVVPAQIIAKQSVKGVEATSRATITGEAIINATAKALAQAHAEPALAPLIEWSKSFGVEMNPKLMQQLKPILESKLSREWTAAQRWTRTKWIFISPKARTEFS